jgi:hypothetical protein
MCFLIQIIKIECKSKDFILKCDKSQQKLSFFAE